MIQLIIALFLALSPSHAAKNPAHGTGTNISATNDDTGGETEPIPPKGPTHPH